MQIPYTYAVLFIQLKHDLATGGRYAFRKPFATILNPDWLVLILLGLLTVLHVQADYLGPNRTVTNYSWKRRVCNYQAVYDPSRAVRVTIHPFLNPKGRQR